MDPITSRSDAIELLASEYAALRRAMELYYKSLERHDCASGKTLEKEVSNRGLGALTARDERVLPNLKRLADARGAALTRALGVVEDGTAQLVRAVKRYCHRTHPWTLAREKRLAAASSYLRGYAEGRVAEPATKAAATPPPAPPPAIPAAETVANAKPAAATPNLDRQRFHVEEASKYARGSEAAENHRRRAQEAYRDAILAGELDVPGRAAVRKEAASTARSVTSLLRECAMRAVAGVEGGFAFEIPERGGKPEPNALTVVHLASGKRETFTAKSAADASIRAACLRVGAFVQAIKKASHKETDKPVSKKQLPAVLTLQAFAAAQGFAPAAVTFPEILKRLGAAYDVPVARANEYKRDHVALVRRAADAGEAVSDEVLRDAGVERAVDAAPTTEALESLVNPTARDRAFLARVGELPLDAAEREVAALEKRSNARNKGVETVLDGERPVGLFTSASARDRAKAYNRTAKNGHKALWKEVAFKMGNKEQTYYVVFLEGARKKGEAFAEWYGKFLYDQFRNRSAITAEREAEMSRRLGYSDEEIREWFLARAARRALNARRAETKGDAAPRVKWSRRATFVGGKSGLSVAFAEKPSAAFVASLKAAGFELTDKGPDAPYWTARADAPTFPEAHALAVQIGADVPADLAPKAAPVVPTAAPANDAAPVAKVIPLAPKAARFAVNDDVMVDHEGRWEAGVVNRDGGADGYLVDVPASGDVTRYAPGEVFAHDDAKVGTPTGTARAPRRGGPDGPGPINPALAAPAPKASAEGDKRASLAQLAGLREDLAKAVNVIGGDLSASLRLAADRFSSAVAASALGTNPKPETIAHMETIARNGIRVAETMARVSAARDRIAKEHRKAPDAARKAALAQPLGAHDQWIDAIAATLVAPGVDLATFAVPPVPSADAQPAAPSGKGAEIAAAFEARMRARASASTVAPVVPMVPETPKAAPIVDTRSPEERARKLIEELNGAGFTSGIADAVGMTVSATRTRLRTLAVAGYVQGFLWNSTATTAGEWVWGFRSRVSAKKATDTTELGGPVDSPYSRLEMAAAVAAFGLPMPALPAPTQPDPSGWLESAPEAVYRLREAVRACAAPLGFSCDAAVSSIKRPAKFEPQEVTFKLAVTRGDGAPVLRCTGWFSLAKSDDNAEHALMGKFPVSLSIDGGATVKVDENAAHGLKETAARLCAALAPPAAAPKTEATSAADAKTQRHPAAGKSLWASWDIAPNVAASLAIPGGVPAAELHVTALYLGKVDEFPPGTAEKFAAAVRKVAAATPGPVRAALGAPGEFPAGDNGVPHYLAVASPQLEAFHAALRLAIAAEGIAWTPTHATYRPHVTLGWNTPIPAGHASAQAGRVLAFASVRVCTGEECEVVPLATARSVTSGTPVFRVKAVDTALRGAVGVYGLFASLDKAREAVGPIASGSDPRWRFDVMEYPDGNISVTSLNTVASITGTGERGALPRLSDLDKGVSSAPPSARPAGVPAGAVDLRDIAKAARDRDAAARVLELTVGARSVSAKVPGPASAPAPDAATATRNARAVMDALATLTTNEPGAMILPAGKFTARTAAETVVLNGLKPERVAAVAERAREKLRAAGFTVAGDAATAAAPPAAASEPAPPVPPAAPEAPRAPTADDIAKAFAEKMKALGLKPVS